MFPGPSARIYRNDAGEPIGWDYPDYDNPEPSIYDEMWDSDEWEDFDDIDDGRLEEEE